MSQDFSLSTTLRRIHALQVFTRQHGQLLPELCEELQALWPHWNLNGHSETTDQYYQALCSFFERLENNCRPELLDAWKPFVTRSRNPVADIEKTVRRFLDSGTGKLNKAKSPRSSRKGPCRVHPEKPIHSIGVCTACCGRIQRFRKFGIINDETPRELLDSMLRLNVKMGVHSNMIADAQELARKYQEGACSIEKQSSSKTAERSTRKIVASAVTALEELERLSRLKAKLAKAR